MCLSHTQVVDGSPIEVTLAKPVDKDSYVRYTRGTGGRGGSVLQTDYTTYSLGQVGEHDSELRVLKDKAGPWITDCLLTQLHWDEIFKTHFCLKFIESSQYSLFFNLNSAETL